MDFGLATFASASRPIFRRCGTPGYISPEVIRLHSGQTPRFSAKSDVYSAGVVLYTLVTGANPFKGKNFREVLQRNKAGHVGGAKQT